MFEGHSIDQAKRMDRMYRKQWSIYDLTRKYYLLGRDYLLERIRPNPGDRILEVGCGTARNSIVLALRYSNIHLYGLDASREMLETATAKISRLNLQKRIILKQGFAEDFDYESTFSVERPFDCIFFSYTLSIVPQWKEAIVNAMQNLRDGGTLLVVDFGNCNRLPGWFQNGLHRWLGLFGVQHRPDLIEVVEALGREGLAIDETRDLYRNYAQFLALHKHRPLACERDSITQFSNAQSMRVRRLTIDV